VLTFSGRAISQLFTREGAKVIIAELDEEAGVETENKIRASHGTALFVRTDVSQEEAGILHFFLSFSFLLLLILFKLH
jgi:NAD(P)-dependent dehydrogenase (short-subunit alcohol dehydrogenase family)